MHAAVSGQVKTVTASVAGARLDSDLLKGGGTDDTSALQKVLDRVSGGGHLHVIIDGAALVSGLNVYSNTTIECTAGGGLYLKDGSSRAIIRNAHRSRDVVRDARIEVRGCFLNGNRANQPSADIPRPDIEFSGPSNKEPDGTYISGLQFLGVNYLTIADVTLWNVRAFAALVANAAYVDIRNVLVDHGGGPDADFFEYLVTDGFHFKGPLRYVFMDYIKLRVGDDGIAFNANDYETDDITVRNDFGPYVGQGPITDVTVNNVMFLPGQLSGIRVLSSNERIDRISINNVSGTVRAALLQIGHWVNKASFGNVGTVTLRNVNVERPLSVKNETLQGVPLMSIDGRVETLGIAQAVTRISSNAPVLRMGSTASVDSMEVGLIVSGPDSLDPAAELEAGAHIRSMKLSLDLQGRVRDQARPLISSRGGTIDSLQWLNTPPMYIYAHAPPGNANVDVVFTQRLKSQFPAAGAKIVVNGLPAKIVGAKLLDDGMTIRYQLMEVIRIKDAATWEYDASQGDLQNWDGSFLRSVTDKAISTGSCDVKLSCSGGDQTAIGRNM